MDKDHLADLEVLRDGVELISRGNVFNDIDAFKTNYQDSDDVNSPSNSEIDEDGNNKRRKGKKRRTTVYPLTRKGQQKMGFIWKWV